MSSPSSAQELPPEVIVIRLHPTTSKMLYVTRSIQYKSEHAMISELTRDWLQSKDRKRTVGGRLTSFQPIKASVFDTEIRFCIPLWLREKLFTAAAGNSSLQADIIRAALEDLLPPLMGGEDLSLLEARVRAEEWASIDEIMAMLQEIRDNEQP